MFSHANPCVCVMVNTIGESFGIDSKYSTTHWETNIANCCDYPSFHFTCLFPDKFVSWLIATSQWTINFWVGQRYYFDLTSYVRNQLSYWLHTPCLASPQPKLSYKRVGPTPTSLLNDPKQILAKWSKNICGLSTSLN